MMSFKTMGYIGLLSEAGGLMKAIHFLFFMATLLISRRLFMNHLLGKLFLVNKNNGKKTTFGGGHPDSDKLYHKAS